MDSDSELAVDLYFLAHDPQTGRSLVAETALGIGLVGAMIIRGLVEGQLTLKDGLLHLLPDHPPVPGLPEDFLRALSAEPASQPDVWLRILAGQAPRWIREELVADGRLMEAPRRTLLGRRTEFYPSDPMRAEYRAVLARGRLTAAHEATVHDAALAGLIRALGLDRGWLRDKPKLRGAVPPLIRRLAPDLFDLVTLVHRTVESTALSPRT